MNEPSATPGSVPLPPTTAIYLVALLLIASLSIGSHVLVDGIVLAQTSSAETVNVSGRQRMLSQRIAKAALESAITADSAIAAAKRSEIGVLSARMQSEQARLAARLPQQSPELAAIYLDAPHRLSEKVGRFVALAQHLASMPHIAPGEPDLARLMHAAESSLPESLDAAVSQYERDAEAAIARIRGLMLACLALMLCVLTCEALFIFRPVFRRLRDAHAALRHAATTDVLTGACNRRQTMATVEQEYQRARRYGQPLSVAMLDVDYFKQVNDHYGHEVGDLVLAKLAETARRCLRATDTFGRLGGEEFLLILPATDLGGAAQAAEKIRMAFADGVTHSAIGPCRVTVSAGVSELQPGDQSVHAPIQRADAALYRAKAAGRNCVEVERACQAPHEPGHAQVADAADGLSLTAASKRTEERLSAAGRSPIPSGHL